MPFVNGTKAAREKIVARTNDDRSEFLRRRGFSKTETAKIIETVLAEGGRKPESVFDFVQGITAVTRDKTHQEAPRDLEARAKKLLDRTARFPQSRICGTARFRFSVSDDIEAIADATVAGMGLAWLPSWLVRGRIAAGALVAMWDERRPAMTDTCAVWPTTEYVPLRLRLAIDMLAANTLARFLHARSPNPS